MRKQNIHYVTEITTFSGDLLREAVCALMILLLNCGLING